MKNYFSKIAIGLFCFIVVMNSIPLNALEFRASNYTHANVVVFAYFSDEANKEYMNTTEFYDEMLQMYEADDSISLKGYLDTVSYGQMIVDNIFPQDNGDGTFTALELPMSKASLKHLNSDVSIIDYIAQSIPQISGENLDYNGDGYIDTLTVVLNGDRYDTKSEFPTTWPHQAYYFGDSEMNGKSVLNYNFLNTHIMMENGIANSQRSGLIIHEYLHGFGYEDLYTETDFTPVGLWDIMAVDTARPQYPLAFLRQEISGWLTLPEYTQSTTSVRVVSQDSDSGAKGAIIKSPYDEYEYFVVEYRKDGTAGEIDSGLFGDGLIVYRVNTTIAGYKNNANETGTYIFRPVEGIHGYNATNSSATLAQAFLAPGIQGDINGTRTSIGSSDLEHGIEDFALTYDNGQNSGIVISNIAFDPADNNAMTFDVEIPENVTVDAWEESGFSTTFSSSSKNIESLNINGTQYVLLHENDSNLLTLKSYDGENWKTLATKNTGEISSSIKLFEYDGSIHVAYAKYNSATYMYDANILRLNANAFTPVNTVENISTGEFDIAVHQGYIYLAMITGDGPAAEQAQLYKVDENTVSAPLIYHSTNKEYTLGTPSVVSTGEKLYAFTRDANLHVYEMSSNATFINHTPTTAIPANMYDITALNGNIYVLVGGGAPNLYEFDGVSWEKSADDNIVASAVEMSTAQGNLYMLTVTDLSAKGDMKVFAYDKETKTWVQEGLRVDVNATDVSLTGTDTRLFVSYVGKNAYDATAFEVRYKDTVNQLKSITVTAPNKLSYLKGETINTTGLVVTANYTNEQRILKPNEYKIAGFETSVSGLEKVAVVSAYGFERSFIYNVSEIPVHYTKISGAVETFGGNVELTLSDTENPDNIFSMTTSSGEFEFLGVKEGTYTLTASKEGYLTHSLTGIKVLDAPVDLTEKNHIKLIAGDIDSSGTVNGNDLLIIMSNENYNKTVGSALNQLTDINNDGIVNFEDVSIARNSANYGKNQASDATQSYTE